MELDVVLKLITGVGAIFGIALTLSHLFAQKSTGKLKKYEMFKELRTYLDDSPDKNFPAICAAVSCLSKRELTLEEVTWFISTPRAFGYLKAYSDQARYIEISEQMDSFRYSEKYSSRTARNLEHLGLIIAYVILASIGLMITMFTQTKAETLPVSIFGYTFGGALVLFGILALLQREHLSNTNSTVKLKFDPTS